MADVSKGKVTRSMHISMPMREIWFLLLLSSKLYVLSLSLYLQLATYIAI